MYYFINIIVVNIVDKVEIYNITELFMLISIDSIKIKTRVREDLGDIESLKESIRTYGLIQPIIINNKNELIAGGRRLAAARSLGYKNIEAKIVDTDDEVRCLELELEENNTRKDFTQDELLAGYERLESLKNPSTWMKVKMFFMRIVAWFKNIFHRGK